MKKERRRYSYEEVDYAFSEMMDASYDEESHEILSERFRRLLWSPNEYVILNKALRDIPEESNLNEITGVMILCKDLIHHQRLRRYELTELLDTLSERLKERSDNEQ